MKRWRFRLLILLLQIPAMMLSAAEKALAPGHVPAAVTRGNLTALGPLPNTNQLRLALDLPLRNAAELTNLLAAMYNPASPQYHHYLSPRQFAARFGPTPQDYAAVMHFAQTNGLAVTAVHSNRLVLDVAGKVADVEHAFHVKLYSYRHPTEPRNFRAPDTEPTVDATLPLLDVSGLDDFYLPHPNLLARPAGPSRHRRTPQGGSSPDGTYMGNDFRQAYLPGTTLTGAGQSVGLLEFDGFYQSDITNYAGLIGLATNMPQVIVMPVDGGVQSIGNGDGEVCLDIEMTMSMSPGVSNIYVYEATNGTVWVDILSQMADDDLAAQLACCWGGGGPDPASEQIFLQMAAQGQSFFNAVGDSCAYTDLVQFPCGSANITEVGGTFLSTDTNGNYVGESAWNRGYGIGTGGGVVPGVFIPPWQLGLDMTTNGGSLVCRNIPDVALTADQVYVYVNNGGWDIGGTSCAAPLWAGVAALINQQAAQLGEPPVGFLNPAIYALCRGTNYAAMFHDIVQGDNTSASSPNEYYAVPGYDLCTGWGTPAGTNLINILTMPDDLGIVPPSAFSASCMVGGPCPQTNWTLTLTNSGSMPLDWSLGCVPAWLAASPGNGTLAADGSASINLQLLGAETLPGNRYFAVLSVTNLALSSAHNATVEADIGQSIVVNGDFETGDFTGWTLVGDTSVSNQVYNVVATDGQFPGVAYSGFFGVFFGENGYAATLSQTLNTIPGQQYLLSWWLDNPNPGAGMQTFSASWDGQNYVSLTNPPAFDWTNFQFVVTADATNTVLEFAAEHDQNYFGLDDVTVTPVPPVGFANVWADTNGFNLTWLSLAGLNYNIQYTTNLDQADWQTLSPIAALTNVTAFVDTNMAPGCGQAFYRLVFVP